MIHHSIYNKAPLHRGHSKYNSDKMKYKTGSPEIGERSIIIGSKTFGLHLNKIGKQSIAFGEVR